MLTNPGNVEEGTSGIVANIKGLASKVAAFLKLKPKVERENLEKLHSADMRKPKEGSPLYQPKGPMH